MMQSRYRDYYSMYPDLKRQPEEGKEMHRIYVKFEKSLKLTCFRKGGSTCKPQTGDHEMCQIKTVEVHLFFPAVLVISTRVLSSERTGIKTGCT